MEKDLPAYDIIPAPHGFWELRKRSMRMRPSYSGFIACLRKVNRMESVGLYFSKEAAEQDAKHLGLDKIE